MMELQWLADLLLVIICTSCALMSSSMFAAKAIHQRLNTWEFPLYVIFLQQNFVFALAVVNSSDISIPLNVLDSTSVVLFLFRGANTRQESRINNTNGFGFFNQRVHVHSQQVYPRFWLVFAGFVCFLAFTKFLICTLKSTFSQYSSDAEKVDFKSSVISLCGLIFTLAILPLSALSSYTIMRAVDDYQIAVATVILLIVSFVVVSSVCYHVAQHHSHCSFHSKAALLFENNDCFKPQYQWFPMVLAITQLLSGLVFGAFSGEIQCVLQIVLRISHLLLILTCEPWLCSFQGQVEMKTHAVLVALSLLSYAARKMALDLGTQIFLWTQMSVVALVCFGVFFRQLVLLWVNITTSSPASTPVDPIQQAVIWPPALTQADLAPADRHSIYSSLSMGTESCMASLPSFLLLESPASIPSDAILPVPDSLRDQLNDIV